MFNFNKTLVLFLPLAYVSKIEQIAADGPGLDALMGAMAITVQGLETRVKNGHAPQPIGPAWWLWLRNFLRI